MNCSVAGALEIVGEWWTFLVLRDAFLGVRRFEDFQRRLGIARNVLTARLQTLVGHGILERRLYQERPERYEYRLTDKGLELHPILVSLMQWGDKWTGVADSPPMELIHKGCGHRSAPASCATTVASPSRPATCSPSPALAGTTARSWPPTWCPASPLRPPRPTPIVGAQRGVHREPG